ncbi:hypothetical protein [Flammeovirga aprica]|uniref:hypothetical protein n=1 Tax=Flammeovirga aprica TaxID=29528 RepID=UPI00197EDF4E|nr:hypothetical protein [Flammeovirga aprica]
MEIIKVKENKSIINSLINFFSKPKSETEGQVPKGLCPNCWGKQEYDNKFRELREDKQINVNNHKENYSFIKEFMVNNLEGIQLIREKDSLTCPVCLLRHEKKEIK